MDYSKLNALMDGSNYAFAERIKDLTAEERSYLESELFERSNAAYERAQAALEEQRIDPILEKADSCIDVSEKLLLVTEKEGIRATANIYGTATLRRGICEKRKPEEGGAKSIGGTLGKDIRQLKKDIEAFEPVEKRHSAAVLTVLAAVGIVLAALLLFHPGVKVFFDGEWLRTACVALCAILVIASFFLGGFVIAIAVLVVLAALFTLLESIGLRVVLAIVLGLVGIGAAVTLVNECKTRTTWPRERKKKLGALAERLVTLWDYSIACGNKMKMFSGYYAEAIEQLKEQEKILVEKGTILEKELKTAK